MQWKEDYKMKTQANDKAKRRRRRDNAKRFDKMGKYYEEEKPVNLESYFQDIDSFEDIEAATNSLPLHKENTEWYY